jgi:nicotinamide mononucleotide transporter
MFDRLTELAHNTVVNVIVAALFTVFAVIGYAVGGEAFLTEWVGSVAAAIGIACLVFKTQGYWVWSIVNAILWFVLYRSWGLDMTAGLQVMYMVMSMYGLFMWATTKDKIGLDTHNWRHALGGVLGFSILAYIIVFASGESQFAMWTNWWYAELAAVVISILAFTMDAFKYRTNWILWSMTNVLFAPIFWHTGLMGPFIMTFVFQTLCFFGMYKWWKDQRELVSEGKVTLVGGAQYA